MANTKAWMTPRCCLRRDGGSGPLLSSALLRSKDEAFRGYGMAQGPQRGRLWNTLWWPYGMVSRAYGWKGNEVIKIVLKKKGKESSSQVQKETCWRHQAFRSQEITFRRPFLLTGIVFYRHSLRPTWPWRLLALHSETGFTCLQLLNH